MVNSKIFEQLPDALLPWYQSNKRQLPWRVDREPYHVWISEIMLQQTRVEAVKGYYARFLNAFPTVEALADADDDKLHKLWEGLGYYSRVRNLKKAAQVIVSEYGGEFPSTHKQILALPGIGDYTAGAICSISFGLPTPAVDGNVLRVVSRLTCDDTPIDQPAYKKAVARALSRVYPKDAGDFTQALMELGATVCGPNRKPDCVNCPCKRFCLGYQRSMAEQLPVKSPKRPKRVEDITVFILCCCDRYALQKRPSKGLLAGLWQFPNISGCLDAQEALLALEKMGLHPRQLIKTVDREHIFTHILWHMHGVYVEVKETNEDFTWMSAGELEAQAALPTAFRQFWNIGEDNYG